MTPKKKVTDLVFFILVIFQLIKRQIALALEKQVRQTNKQTNELKKDRKGESWSFSFLHLPFNIIIVCQPLYTEQ